MEIDEQRIVFNCQKGDLEDFGLLYETYFKRIYSFVYYRTNHRETAEDLTSLVFLKALEKIRNFKKGSFSAWLYRIARNSVIDHYRVSKTYLDLVEAMDRSGNDICADMEQRELLEQVGKLLDKLDQTQRDIVVMRLWDGLNYREISEIVDKTEENCKVIFGRTLVKIRQEIGIGASLLILSLLIK